MEMKGLKENEQDEKEKLKHWKLAQNSSKQVYFRGTRPSESTLVKLGIFSSNSLKQVITRLSEMSLSPSPTGFNRKHEA